MVRYDEDGAGRRSRRLGARADARGGRAGSTMPLDGDTATTRVWRRAARRRIEDYDEGRARAGRALRGFGVAAVVAAPITHRGRLWGARRWSRAWSGSRSRPAPSSGSRDFAELAAQALANAEARDELAASRARIVQAGDAERRRLERNLHDGAQQRLVSLSLTLRLAARRLRRRRRRCSTRAPARSSRRRWRSCARSRAACTRRSSPSTGSSRRCACSPSARRCRSSSTSGSRSGSRPVEAAAYYVVAEALDNVAKHAGDARSACAWHATDGRP